MTTAAPARMTRQEALIDAALTRQRWERRYPNHRPALRLPSHQCWNTRIMRHVAHQLGCYPAWDAIEVEMTRRLLADEPARVADAA